MAQQQSKGSGSGAERVSLAGAERITLDDLISQASGSVLRLTQQQGGGLKVPPRIWVGIWIDLDQNRFDQLGGATQGNAPRG